MGDSLVFGQLYGHIPFIVDDLPWCCWFISSRSFRWYRWCCHWSFGVLFRFLFFFFLLSLTLCSHITTMRKERGKIRKKSWEQIKTLITIHQYHKKDLDEINLVTSKKVINSDWSGSNESLKCNWATYHLWWHFLILLRSHWDFFTVMMVL